MAPEMPGSAGCAFSPPCSWKPCVWALEMRTFHFCSFDSLQHCNYRMPWLEFLSWKRILYLAIPFPCNILQSSATRNVIRDFKPPTRSTQSAPQVPKVKTFDSTKFDAVFDEHLRYQDRYFFWDMFLRRYNCDYKYGIVNYANVFILR